MNTNPTSLPPQQQNRWLQAQGAGWGTGLVWGKESQRVCAPPPPDPPPYRMFALGAGAVALGLAYYYYRKSPAENLGDAVSRGRRFPSSGLSVSASC